jgi:hypothetical protein
MKCLSEDIQPELDMQDASLEMLHKMVN